MHARTGNGRARSNATLRQLRYAGHVNRTRGNNAAERGTALGSCRRVDAADEDLTGCISAAPPPRNCISQIIGVSPAISASVLCGSGWIHGRRCTSVGASRPDRLPANPNSFGYRLPHAVRRRVQGRGYWTGDMIGGNGSLGISLEWSSTWFAVCAWTYVGWSIALMHRCVAH